ncbi:uncharacterized protein LOC143878139 [Tasmannia lanceolata]|uniref:uncharacterized protein LOC143878139 n=1 Tax=Tasmannia lanceolata TaxID=3420 RepID=UPI004062C9CE
MQHANKVYEAALKGSVTSLNQLLEQDAGILDRFAVVGVEGNPLHVATLRGHAHFAKEILSRKPEFASQPNSKGYLPLHLASAKGNIEFVKDLLQRVQRNRVMMEKSNEGFDPPELKDQARDANYNNCLQIDWGWVLLGGSKRKKELEKEEASWNDARNTLVVVAILIATVTYTSGLTPPGGYWQGEFKKNEVELKKGQRNSIERQLQITVEWLSWLQRK